MSEERKILNVDGMTCSHCVDAVKNAICSLKGINNVDIDISRNYVMVAYDSEKQNLDSIKKAIEEAGYQVKA